jgi:ferredoxin--NADP+ reductase
MPINVAIVGAGPAGFYVAEALLEKIGSVRIDIIEKLPTPYGLIRAGVAPDHQTTKNVSRRFESTALREKVRFFGNVQLGKDVTVAELRDIYDAVILAIGTQSDRPLGVPGENKRGVYGSTAFVSWFNGHPDFRDLNPEINTSAAVVVGNGNVAIDIARVLVKSKDEMAVTDTPDYAAAALQNSGITDVYILGRRGPAEASFTNVELREMGRLAECTPIVEPFEVPASLDGLNPRDEKLKRKNLATLQKFVDRANGNKPKRAHFKFHMAPVEILGKERIEGVRVEKTRVENGRAVGTGEFLVIDCGLLVAAIGYRAMPIEGVPFDPDRGLIPNDDGRIDTGLYAVGWAKRGPTGVIASNKPDGIGCAEQIHEDIRRGKRPGREALERLISKRNVRAVSFDEWLEIDAAEVASATAPAPRRKLTTFREILSVIDRAKGNAPTT